MKGSIFQSTTSIESTVTGKGKEGTAIAVRKGIPHRQVDLPPAVSIERTGICILTGNYEVLLAYITYTHMCISLYHYFLPIGFHVFDLKFRNSDRSIHVGHCLED
jgi:hypothetical protein